MALRDAWPQRRRPRAPAATTCCRLSNSSDIRLDDLKLSPTPSAQARSRPCPRDRQFDRHARLLRPILIGKDNVVIDGVARIEAARLLGLDRAPCIRIEHLSDDEQRLCASRSTGLRRKANGTSTALKIEFEELILVDAPIEIDRLYARDEIDQIMVLDPDDGVERGPLAPEAARCSRRPARRPLIRLDRTSLVCGDATDPAVLRRLMSAGSRRPRLRRRVASRRSPQGRIARPLGPDRRALQCRHRRQCHRRRAIASSRWPRAK